MKPFIVFPDGFDKNLFDTFKNNPNFDVHPDRKLDQAKLKELLPRVNGIVIRSATTMNKEMIDLAPNLKLIIRAGEGTDNIDKKYAQEKGVKVANTPGSNSNAAAEQAIALMFTLLRKTAFAHISMKQGKWEKALFEGNELTGKTVGFVGLGKIGYIVAKRISGFEPKVLFFDPYMEKCDLPYAKKVNTLDEIFKQSDIVTIHVPLVDGTKNLVTQHYLDMMKPTSFLINAARGKIVDENALYETLAAKKIKGAAFDVFAAEPLSADSKLLTLDNMVVNPHLGASTEEAAVRVGEMTLNQLNEFFMKNNLLNEVRV